MKRFVSLMLASLMICSMFAFHTAAVDFSQIDFLTGILRSQEGDDDPDIPKPPVDPVPPVDPEEPQPEIPEVPEEPEVPEVPEEPEAPLPAKPVSPQTGYGFGIVALSAVAAASGAVAVIAGKKASKRD